ncbi:MAG: nucleoside diphosphate kinase regulator [Lentisphaerae bacterium]|jgi:regulator of nucleoside diphosphate kinase|nr:nucleoside diphosphate kinase regulator [Lentisphaerota bacterium]
MKKRKIYITSFDKDRLEELVAVAGDFGEHRRSDLEILYQELQRAMTVEAKKIPADVVTMNSKVLLRDTTSGREMTYSLVFPREANIDTGAISVLAPIGTAILGYREGDIVEWEVPSGKRTIKIEKILYQPEAVGDYHL